MTKVPLAEHNNVVEALPSDRTDDDDTAFVAIWYAVACAIMAFIGAVVGHRILRW